jgi:hypothetical protein
LSGALRIGPLFPHGFAGPVSRNKLLNQNGCKLTRQKEELKGTVYLHDPNKVKLIIDIQMLQGQVV